MYIFSRTIYSPKCISKKPLGFTIRKGLAVNIVWFLAYARGAAGRLLIRMDNVCSAFQKASPAVNTRKKAAGRLHIPMDNVCSACLPPSCLAHEPYNVTLPPFAPMLRNRDQKLRF